MSRLISGTTVRHAEPFDRHRIGRFSVSLQLLERATPETLRALFDGMAIVEATSHIGQMTIEYTAFSPHFEPASKYTMVAEYVATVTVSDDRSISVAWSKVDNSAHARAIDFADFVAPGSGPTGAE